MPLAAGTVDFDFEDLWSECELTCAGAASQLDWSLVGTCYDDGVAVRTGECLIGQVVNSRLVADPADCTAYLAFLLAQSLRQHMAAMGAF